MLYFIFQHHETKDIVAVGNLLALSGVIFTLFLMTYICHLLINPKRAFCRSTASSTAILLAMLYKLPITIYPDFSMKLMIYFSYMKFILISVLIIYSGHCPPSLVQLRHFTNILCITPVQFVLCLFVPWLYRGTVLVPYSRVICDTSPVSFLLCLVLSLSRMACMENLVSGGYRDINKVIVCLYKEKSIINFSFCYFRPGSERSVSYMAKLIKHSHT